MRTAIQAFQYTREHSLRKDYTFHNFKVGTQGILQNGMPKETAVGYITHQQLYNDKELMDCLVEARCSGGWWGASNSLKEVGVCRCIVQLHGSYTAQVIVIASVLRIDCRRWERGLRDQFVRLII